MKKILLLSAVFCFHFALKAQKVYFIYLQSESGAPFYVKMAGKIQSSTTEGYLILSKLVDSTYLISIGQPGKQNEPRFSITISRGDRGFLIKNIDGTFGLFDLQTLALYKPLTAESGATQTVPRNDSFTKLLAKATDDTTVLSQPILVVQQQKPKAEEPKAEAAVVKEQVVPKKDTVQNNVAPTVISTPENGVVANHQAIKKDTVVQKQPEVITAAPQETAVVKEEVKPSMEEEYKKSVVSKKSESSTSEGFGLVFLDSYDGVTDTIEVTIPNPKIILNDTVQKESNESKQFLEITNDKDAIKKDTIAVATTEAVTSTKHSAPCTSLSSDDDFFKLRKNMTSENNDDDMIAQAKRYFKGKCFRTEQIKYLSNLFLTDEGKYQFFDAAYSHVSDLERFFTLQTELKDTYYINRFKALIGN